MVNINEILGNSYDYYRRNLIAADGRPLADPDLTDLDKDGDLREKITFSEGVSYVMLRAVERNDRETFDKVWRWTQKNLQRQNISQLYNPATKAFEPLDPAKRDHLFAWRYLPGVNDRPGAVLTTYDIDPASDADQDIAAALLLAAQKWGQPNYKTEAVAILNDIWTKETKVINNRRYLLGGDTQIYTKDPLSGEPTFGINLSYLRPTYYNTLFAQNDSVHDWRSLTAPAYELIEKAGDTTFHNETGAPVEGKVNLVPDWIALDSQGRIRDHGWKKDDHSRNDYYMGGDAFRTLFWLATQAQRDPGDSAARRYMTDASGTAADFGPLAFLRKEFAARGTLVSGYNLDGTPHWAGESLQTLAVYMAYFAVAGDKETANKIMEKIMVNYNPDGFWRTERENDFYYAQNWIWFSLSLINDDPKNTFLQGIIAGAPTTAAASGPAPSTPGKTLPFGEIDSSIGFVGCEGRPRLDAEKIKFEIENGRLDVADLAQVLRAIAAVPKQDVLAADFDSYNLAQLLSTFPELKTIHGLDQQKQTHLLSFFVDSRQYWANAITLLGVYLQYVMENSNLQALAEANSIAQAFQNRLETQKAADATSKVKRLPPLYNLAELNFIQAEIYSQAKEENKAYYQQGIALVRRGIAQIEDLQNQPTYPSKPDYFTLLKGLITLADLYQKLANLTHNQDYYRTAFAIYQSISATNERGGIKIDLTIPDGPNGYRLKLVAAPKVIDEAITFNIDHGYINPTARKNTLAGIYHYHHGIALLKQAGALVAWPRLKSINNVAEQIINVESAKQELLLANRLTGEDEIANYITFRTLGKIAAQALTGLFWKDFSTTPPIEAQLNTIDRVNSSFFLDLATMVEGELLLLLADRIRYYPENTAANQKTIDDLKRFPALNSAMAQAEQTLNQQYPGTVIISDLDSFGDQRNEIWLKLWNLYPWIINSLGGTDPNLDAKRLDILSPQDKSTVLDIFKRNSTPYSGKINHSRLADILVASARDSFFPNINQRFPYLHIWARIKQLEINIRDAAYVAPINQLGEPTNFLDGKNFSTVIYAVNDPRRQLDEAKTISEVLPQGNIQENEYLGVEFDFIRVIYLLAGIPTQKNGVYVKVKNLVDPEETISLINKIRGNYRDFNEEDRIYFEVQLNIREAGALTQLKRYDEALSILQASDRLVASPLPTHITDKIQQVIRVLANNLNSHQLDITNKILNVAQIMLDYNSQINRYSYVVAADKRQPVQEALIAAGCLDRGGKVKPDFLNRQGQFAQNLNTKKLQLTAAETAQIFDVLKRADVFAQLGRQMKAVTALIGRRDFPAAAAKLTELMNQLGTLDNSVKFEQQYGERLTLDLHSIRAELYHFMTVASSLSSTKPKGDVVYEFGQSTYFESRRSTVKYDLFYRPTFMTMDFPDIAEDRYTF
ncbi:MAG: glycosyl hydrolase family 8 [Candidatus Margulisiibacteriota bacterium]|jgi:endo-1,4-beta-D-glucanase Y